MALQRYMGLFSNSAPLAAPMATLPDELVIRILSELTWKKLITGLTVCKRFGLLSQDDTLWERLFLKRYGVAVKGPNIMEKFMLHFACEREFKKLQELYLYDQEKRVRILHTLQELDQALGRVMPDDPKNPDRSWTTYLRGKWRVNARTFLSSLKVPDEEVQARFQEGIDYLLESERLGNPLAMICLSGMDQSPTPEDKFKRLSAAHATGCLEGTHELAMFCIREVTSRRGSTKYIRMHAELLLQAAKGGHAKSAFYLASGISDNFNSTIHYMPLSELDWAFFNFHLGMWDKFDNDLYTPEVIAEDLAMLKAFIDRGSCRAAFVLSDFYYMSEAKLNIRLDRKLAAHYKDLAKQLFDLAAPARKAEKIFWLNEAIKGGLRQADEKEAREILERETEGPKEVKEQIEEKVEESSAEQAEKPDTDQAEQDSPSGSPRSSV